MEQRDRFEDERAAKEARESIVNRPAGSKTAAIAAALKRYLSAEGYRSRRQGEKHDD